MGEQERDREVEKRERERKEGERVKENDKERVHTTDLKETQKGKRQKKVITNDIERER
jgi:hypothetical protein